MNSQHIFDDEVEGDNKQHHDSERSIQMELIRIFDTTLRDGEQSPGNSMKKPQKVAMAHQLERLGVDVIEAGFPASSIDDFEAVSLIARETSRVFVAGLSRAVLSDIDRTWEAVKHAGERAMIHTFIATSPLHMEKKLRKTPAQVLEDAVKAVRHARNYTSNIEFSLEDATRSDRRFVMEVVLALVEAGVSVINLPDTVGYAHTKAYGDLIRLVHDLVPKEVIISAHCHNDLGNALNNSMAAVINGARQIECTINGIGERAGNCSLEQLAMNMAVKNAEFPYVCRVKTELLYPTSQLLVSLTGNQVPANAPIVGANAFAHESGIHQQGVLADPACYEIMTPAMVGLEQSRLVLGKHSGRAALAQRVEQLGYPLDKDGLNDLFVLFKALADKKGEVFDEDILALLGVEMEQGPYKLSSMTCTLGTETVSTSTVLLSIDGELRKTAELGDGPVDATFKAILKLVKKPVKLKKYQVRGLTDGTGALGEVIVQLECGHKTATGRASDTDVVLASAKAFVNGLNALTRAK